MSGRGRSAVLVQLNAPAVKFDLVQPLIATRWSGSQGRCSWWQITRNHMGIWPQQACPSSANFGLTNAPVQLTEFWEATVGELDGCRG